MLFRDAPQNLCRAVIAVRFDDEQQLRPVAACSAGLII